MGLAEMDITRLFRLNTPAPTMFFNKLTDDVLGEEPLSLYPSFCGLSVATTAVFPTSYNSQGILPPNELRQSELLDGIPAAPPVVDI